MKTLDLLLLILAILGGIDLASKGWHVLASLFPRLLSFQARMWRFMADSVALPGLRRRAVVTRVEEVLNQTAFRLHQHLPKGWVKRARIRWIRHPKTSEFLNGELLLRMRPESGPDSNLMQALCVYFDSALFPDTRDLIPKNIVTGIALAITRSSLEETHPYLVPEFDKKFLGTHTDQNSLVYEGFSDCVRLNEFGLLMGPYVREIDYAANKCRFRVGREGIPAQIKAIGDHMLGFQPLLRLKKPEDEWYYHSPYSSYGFLLVSRPPGIRPGVQAYVKRAQKQVEKGIERLYIIGRSEERAFVAAVTEAILTIRELKGLELFTLYRDYRGEPEGVGTLLGVDSLISKLKIPPRILPNGGTNTIESEMSDDITDRIERDERDSAAFDLQQITEDVIIQLSDFEGEWIPLADFGSRIRQQIPGFSPERYGGRNLITVLKRLDTLEFDERGAGSAKAVYVRLARPSDRSRLESDNSELFEKVAAIVRHYSNDDGWIFLGRLGHCLKVDIENFSPRLIGEDTLHGFVSRIPTIEVEERGENHSKTYVRAKKSGEKFRNNAHI